MLEELRQANEKRAPQIDCGRATLMFRCVELGGEAGEALNVAKKLHRQRLDFAPPDGVVTAEALAEELADVVICADLVAMHEGIDLVAALREKFNRTSEKYEVDVKLGESASARLGRVQHSLDVASIDIMKLSGALAIAHRSLAKEEEVRERLEAQIKNRLEEIEAAAEAKVAAAISELTAAQTASVEAPEKAPAD